MSAIADSIISFGFEEQEQISLPLTTMRTMAGRIEINGKAEWMLPLMNGEPSTSLIHIDFLGNISKLSRISFNPKYEQQVLNQLIGLNFKFNPRHKEKITQATNYSVPVDLESLKSFIQKTKQTLERCDKNTNIQYKKALIRNLLFASQLLDLVVIDRDVATIPEHWKETDSGRVYGSGFSLQRLPKQVRNAALGKCHQYDIMAASYALMTGLAQQFDPKIKVAAIFDYVKYRESIRQNIAADLKISEDRVKEIFTSLGFGASTVDTLYKSIRASLSEAQYNTLMSNRHFKHILENIELVRSVILKHFDDKAPFFGLTYHSNDPKSDPLKPKKRTKNQKLAWIYQAMESHAISSFIEQAGAKDHIAILPTHDCLYFKNRLPVDLINDITIVLQSRFPLLRFDHTAILPIRENDYQHKAYNDYYEHSRNHMHLMSEQEFALGYMKNEYDPLQLDISVFSDTIKEIKSGKEFLPGLLINLNN
ncbi:hypothetical protein [Polaromonas sp.]|uniref:hypothetical protein n=1 Tax=Polaromonas sp. TaxID=1869339 RepID=UPI0013BCA61E|nr:hypothetical protein [Polaromonas sp.]NDP64573.1 hypothetical protein [Polaromonas sp.]